MKRVLFIPTGGGQPAQQQLLAFWLRATQTGIERDIPESVSAFDAVTKQLFYYGDWSGQFTSDYDEAVDVLDCNEALEALCRLRKSRDFRRRHYDSLPGKSALKEFVMDFGTPLASSVGLGGVLLERVYPEFKTYSDERDLAARQLRERIVTWLDEQLVPGESTLLISHGFGNVLAYDALWSLSHESDNDQKVDQWLSLGSPLTDNNVQRRLNGAREGAAKRYPTNVLRWCNVAAEDDHICHDKTAANDYAAMLQRHLLAELEDEVVYNLTVRFGRSDPHSSLGYLTHPKVARRIASWLEA